MQTRYIYSVIAFSLAALCFFLIFQACSTQDSGTENTGNTGSAIISIQWPDDVLSTQADIPPQASAISSVNCSTLGVSTITANFTDSTGSTVLATGSWQCSAHGGRVDNIRVGSDLKVIVIAKNSSGKILYRGERQSITITAGEINYLGAVSIDSMVPYPLAGGFAYSGTTTQYQNNDVGNSVGLWGRLVSPMTSYNLYASTDGSNYSKVDVTNLNYQNAFFFMTNISSNTYFRTSAVTPEGESDLSTPIRVDYDDRNNMSAISITSPTAAAGATGISRTPTVRWTAPSGVSVSGYLIQLRQAEAFSEISLKAVPAGTTTWNWGDSVTYTYVDAFPASLKASTIYSIGIGALDAGGNVVAKGGLFFTTGQ